MGTHSSPHFLWVKKVFHPYFSRDWNPHLGSKFIILQPRLRAPVDSPRGLRAGELARLWRTFRGSHHRWFAGRKSRYPRIHVTWTDLKDRKRETMVKRKGLDCILWSWCILILLWNKKHPTKNYPQVPRLQLAIVAKYQTHMLDFLGFIILMLTFPTTKIREAEKTSDTDQVGSSFSYPSALYLFGGAYEFGPPRAKKYHFGSDAGKNFHNSKGRQ